METIIIVSIIAVSLVLLLALGSTLMGVIVISERQVGVVVKKWSMGRQLSPARLVALHGEPGYQADTLAPGLHLFYWPWQYTVHKVPVTVVPQSEIALVVAADGMSIPPERILGQVVECDNFQDARKFLAGGGEKGRQLGLLTAGTYRINTALFSVITSANADKHGMTGRQLQVYRVEPDRVGIVTTLDGRPIEQSEIAGPIIAGHDSFQNSLAFLNNGGRRGLQEQVLLSGSWNLNPWFAQVEQVPMTEIPIGYVGVVISYVGAAHEDVSGVEFKHGDLVNSGHKGVWVTPLYPGKHPINSRVMKVELVPTTNIVLNWASRTEAHRYDQNLSSITVRSKDGFAFNLDVAQIIHVGALDAPKVISRVGSMQNLVDHVLQPIVGNYFRNSAQGYTVLDFLSARSERQAEASAHIRKAIGAYDVQAIDTLIGDITPPAALMQTQTERKIAEEQRKTYEVQEAAQAQRQQLVRQISLANIQQQVVAAEQGVGIAELQAQSNVKQATGQAEAIRLRATGEAQAVRMMGQAQADAYKAGVQSLGPQGFTALQLMQVIGDQKVRIVPDVSVTGAGSAGLLEAILGMMARPQSAVANNKATPTAQPTEHK